jgi:small subunit ribosomal protein S4
MGDPRRIRSAVVRPKRPWASDRLTEELPLVGQFGLRSKRELYMAESFLRKTRRAARSYLALPASERATRERELISRLHRLGLVEERSTLDSVLSLDLSAVLSRRLQSIVQAKGLARSPYESRQMITHGKITVNGAVVRSPSRLVTREEEQHVAKLD